MSEEKTYTERDLLIRIDSWRESFDREIRSDIAEIKAVQMRHSSDIEELRREWTRQQGGLGAIRWIWGALGGLPFLGGVVGYFIAQRG